MAMSALFGYARMFPCREHQVAGFTRDAFATAFLRFGYWMVLAATSFATKIKCNNNKLLNKLIRYTYKMKCDKQKVLYRI